jgi:hypothetical protein
VVAGVLGGLVAFAGVFVGEVVIVGLGLGVFGGRLGVAG